MKSDWTRHTTGELFDLINGYAFKSSDFKDSGVPIIKIKNVKAGEFIAANFDYVDNEFLNTKPDKIVKPGDLLITMSGNRHDGSKETWVGKIAWFNKPQQYIVNQRVGILRLRDTENYDARFLSYQLSSDSFQNHFISVATSSGGQANLSPLQISNTELYVPDRTTQDRIVSILGGLEDKIELNRQINQTLEQIAQAIFKSWFVDFEPVRAKIKAKEEGRDPERATMCAISGKSETDLDQLAAETLKQLATTAALFPDELDVSELEEIPKGWEWSSIGNEVDVVGGGTPSTKKQEFWEEGEYYWTTPKDLSGLVDKVLLNTERKITKSGIGEISSGLLPVDTVLMSSRAPVGYLVLAKVPTAVNQGFIAMKCNKRLPPEYVLQWANSVMDEVKQRASGSTFSEINKKTFRPMTILVPAMPILKSFTKLSQTIYDKITESVAESNTLSMTRDSLLPKLLTGEISVQG